MISSPSRPKALFSTVPSSSSLSFSAPPPGPFGSVQEFQSPPSYPLHCKQWGPLDFLMVLRIELEFQVSGTPPRYNKTANDDHTSSTKLSMLLWMC